MINRLKFIIITGLYVFFAFTAFPAMASAADGGNAKSQVCSGIGLSGSDCGSKATTESANSLIATITNTLSVIVGVAAVIMIIVAGLKYVTSGGDSNKTGSAKTTLIYAILGLFIVAIAQLLVYLVFSASKTIAK